MWKKLSTRPRREFKNAFKKDDTRFMIAVGLKVSGISFVISLVVYFFLFQVIRLNHAFFKAHGFPEFSEGTPYYDYILTEALENLPLLFAFHIFLFFIGVYVGWLILRPFCNMGDYCEKVLDNPNHEYRVDDFSTYKLLIRFSEFFFEYLRDARKKGSLSSSSIPPQFMRIHRPVLDKTFMLHFGMLLIIISICSSVFIIETGTTVYTNMINLASTTLRDYRAVNRYFTEQLFILDDLVYLTITLIVLGYTMLGLHLYAKVSGAAFGIFSTMRSFMKGNFLSRVHLVGYGYVRDYTRKLNKYLDYVQNNFDKEKSDS